MKPVKFKSAWRMYQPGEIAGFADDIAQSLVEAGVAVDVDAEPEVPADTQQKADEKAGDDTQTKVDEKTAAEPQAKAEAKAAK